MTLPPPERAPGPGWVGTCALAAIAIPVLGVLMGGIYWLPAAMSASRRPWLLHLLLGLGLTVSSGGLGLWLGLPLGVIAGIWAVGQLLLALARRIHGDLAHGIERFGPVHAITCVLVVAAAAIPGLLAR